MASPDHADSLPAASVSSRWRSIVAVLLLIVAVVATYCPWSVLTGREVLLGTDHLQLHSRRMAFAREALFGPSHALPAWYPREQMGTPFRANLQNFPLIPTRLIVLLLFDPQFAFEVSAVASAVLSALFTFLLCRRWRMSRIASAAGGWTFACAGFFAARVLAGHLPLLEAYPALPALLWLTDRALTEASRRTDWSLIALSLATACFALAGHPQLTIYSLGIAGLYAVARRVSRRAVSVLLAMLLGLGIAGAALYPMALLTGRSTRVLELDRADNDLAMPYGRLPALLFPWKDGWAATVQREPNVPFTGYPYAVFWDTSCYVGWAPCIAAVALGAAALIRRRASFHAIFIAAVGAAALLLALPSWQNLMSHVPGTFLRSPARLMYVVDFALAMALAGAIDQFLRRSSRRLLMAAVVLVLVAHGTDLAHHARAFVYTRPPQRDPFPAEQFDSLTRILRSGRVGFDYELATPLNRALDDVGFFDSLMLARPYRFILDTSGMPPTLNTQAMSASEMSRRTLRACGVRLIWTRLPRPDLRPVGDPNDGVSTYAVVDAAQRCEFFPASRLRWGDADEIHRLLRDPSFPLETMLLLPASARPVAPMTQASPQFAAQMRYRRPDCDSIEVDATTDQAGYVRVLETFDPGWSATVDGAATMILPGDDTFLTAPVSAGSHQLRFHYHTPGATAGVVISVISFLLVIVPSVFGQARTFSFSRSISQRSGSPAR
jgi:hypothetical protein